MPVAGAKAAGVIDGIMYVVGGSSGGGIALQAYDPASDTWTTKASLLDQMISVSAAVLEDSIGSWRIQPVRDWIAHRVLATGSLILHRLRELHH